MADYDTPLNHDAAELERCILELLELRARLRVNTQNSIMYALECPEAEFTPALRRLIAQSIRLHRSVSLPIDVALLQPLLEWLTANSEASLDIVCSGAGGFSTMQTDRPN